MLDQFEDVNGFDFRKFPKNTRIVLKTKNSCYEIEIIENQTALITGGTMPNHGIRFPVPTCIQLVGSVKKNSWFLKENYIQLGMNLQFVIEKTDQSVMTSEITDIEIYAKDNSWCHFVNLQKAVPIAG